MDSEEDEARFAHSNIYDVLDDLLALENARAEGVDPSATAGAAGEAAAVENHEDVESFVDNTSSVADYDPSKDMTGVVRYDATGLFTDSSGDNASVETGHLTDMSGDNVSVENQNGVVVDYDTDEEYEPDRDSLELELQPTENIQPSSEEEGYNDGNIIRTYHAALYREDRENFNPIDVAVDHEVIPDERTPLLNSRDTSRSPTSRKRKRHDSLDLVSRPYDKRTGRRQLEHESTSTSTGHSNHGTSYVTRNGHAPRFIGGDRDHSRYQIETPTHSRSESMQSSITGGASTVREEYDDIATDRPPGDSSLRCRYLRAQLRRLQHSIHLTHTPNVETTLQSFSLLLRVLVAVLIIFLIPLILWYVRAR